MAYRFITAAERRTASVCKVTGTGKKGIGMGIEIQEKDCYQSDK